MRTKDRINTELNSAQTRLNLYINREADMLNGGVQSYGMGTRNLARYNTDLATIRNTIKELKQEVRELEAELSGSKPRRAVGVVIRDW